MTVRWKLAEHLERKGWENAHQFSKGAQVSYPVAWRIMQNGPVDRIEVTTLEHLATVFGVRKPWELLDWGKR